MKSVVVPVALRERLGNPGAAALTEMLDTHMRESIEFALEKSGEGRKAAQSYARAAELAPPESALQQKSLARAQSLTASKTTRSR